MNLSIYSNVIMNIRMKRAYHFNFILNAFFFSYQWLLEMGSDRVAAIAEDCQICNDAVTSATLTSRKCPNSQTSYRSTSDIKGEEIV